MINEHMWAVILSLPFGEYFFFVFLPFVEKIVNDVKDIYDYSFNRIIELISLFWTTTTKKNTHTDNLN